MLADFIQNYELLPASVSYLPLLLSNASFGIG